VYIRRRSSAFPLFKFSKIITHIIPQLNAVFHIFLKRRLFVMLIFQSVFTRSKERRRKLRRRLMPDLTMLDRICLDCFG
jgi:hypothetical protein